MTVAKSTQVTLEEFLQLPETKPASEYVDGAIVQKPMLKSRHSRLQGKLLETINEVVEPQQLAYSFPELRCTFGDRSLGVSTITWVVSSGST